MNQIAAIVYVVDVEYPFWPLVAVLAVGAAITLVIAACAVVLIRAQRNRNNF